MDFKELIYRVLLELEPLVPLTFVILGVTLLLLLLMLLRYRKFKFGNNKKSSVGLFFGLSKINSLQLTLSLLKVIVICYYAIIFRELKIIDYITIGIPCVLFCFVNKKFAKVIENLFWTIIQVLALVASKIIYSYAFNNNSNIYLKYLYFGLVVIIFIYSLYLFWNDIIYISNLRDIDPSSVFINKEERKPNNEEE